MVENAAPQKAWEALVSQNQAQLVDVRTDAEWNFVGVPDLSEAGKRAALIPWQIYPTMQVNGRFIDQMRQAGLTPENTIYFLCRSGARSMAAAMAAIEAGFPNAINVADGFEGPPDSQGHRGTVAGWKAAGLPWQQR
jgi:rhodanese-related sulfurtransferase